MNIKYNKGNKICVFSLTFNRPEYIERSFDSLYKRAGCEFRHYVFDDNSDNDTIRTLKKLRKKYHFKLFLNKERQHIYKNFFKNVKEIPLDFDYYVKFDSDVEILSDNLFPLLIENFKFPDIVKGLTMRVEGVRNIDRHDAQMEFFGGHTIKYNAPIVYGCCMMLTNEVFREFKRLTEKELNETIEKWAIDTMLYDTALKLGKFLIVEDLSVYHIDNTYGQRRRNPFYFKERKRWDRIDIDEIWYIEASKILYPKYIERNIYEKIKRNSFNFKFFLENCKEYLKENIIKENPLKVEEMNEIIKKEKVYINKMFKVTSPLNFRPDSNIKHGEFKYFSTLPKWAENNPRLVIESENVKTKSSTLGKKEANNEKKTKKDETIHKCKYCNYSSKSLKRLKTHYLTKHNKSKKYKKL